MLSRLLDLLLLAMVTMRHGDVNLKDLQKSAPQKRTKTFLHLTLNLSHCPRGVTTDMHWLAEKGEDSEDIRLSQGSVQHDEAALGVSLGCLSGGQQAQASKFVSKADLSLGPPGLALTASAVSAGTAGTSRRAGERACRVKAFDRERRSPAGRGEGTADAAVARR